MEHDQEQIKRGGHKFAVTFVGESEDNIGVRTVKGVEVCLGDIDVTSRCRMDHF